MLSSSSSSLSDIKSITTARFFSFGAGVVGLVSSNEQTEYRINSSICEFFHTRQSVLVKAC